MMMGVMVWIKSILIKQVADERTRAFDVGAGGLDGGGTAWDADFAEAAGAGEGDPRGEVDCGRVGDLPGGAGGGFSGPAAAGDGDGAGTVLRRDVFCGDGGGWGAAVSGQAAAGEAAAGPGAAGGEG